MSTGAECYIVEREPGKWFYEIQNWPYGETDDFDTHGPFSSAEAAERHLMRNYANPGGLCIEPHPDSDDDDLSELQ